MTNTIAAKAEPAEAPVPARGRRRTAGVIAGVGAVVLVAAIAMWGAMASEASAQVRVLPGPHAMVCNGKTVPYRINGSDGDEPRPTYVIQIEKGMACQFSVSVVNHSSHRITVRDLTFPAIRPDSDNAGPVIIEGSDSSQTFHGSGNGLDAVYDVGESIAPGESASYDFRLVANPRACDSAGTARLTRFPATHVSVLHRHRTVAGDVSIDVRIKQHLNGSGC